MPAEPVIISVDTDGPDMGRFRLVKGKILESLHKIDTKKIGMDQLERLLKGEIYASIPDVLI
jgi:hypothetical protein